MKHVTIRIILILLMVIPAIIPSNQVNAAGIINVGANNTVEIDIPVDGGDHFSVSLDNVNWSSWYKKSDFPSGKTELTLPVGDGFKNVFIKTGTRVARTFPVYSPTAPNKVVYIETGEFQFIPTGQIRAHKFLLDLTPPEVRLRTADGLNVAVGGGINFILDITDNLDKTPHVNIEVISRHKTGTNVGELFIEHPTNPPIGPRAATINGVDIFSGKTAVAGNIQNGRTSITIPLRNMEPLVINNRTHSYIFKATVTDSSGNRTVVTQQFFVRN